MTKAEIEIKNLKKNLNSDEAYFFLSSIIDADKENSPKRRVRRLLSFLREHKKFKETILEFYLKSPKAKFRCVTIKGVDVSLRDFLIGTSLKRGSPILKVVETKKPMLLNDMKQCIDKRAIFVGKSGIISSYILPARNYGIFIISKKKGKFCTEEIRLLQKYLKWIILPSLDSAINNEQNFNDAIKDSLTGLYNKRYFLLQLGKEFKEHMRRKNNLSLIIIDVDHFKHFNDINGHLLGDKVLRKIGEILSHYVRAGDVSTRFGGEEFCVILPNTNLKEGVNVAEHLRKIVSSTKFEKGELQPLGKVSISLGVSTFPDFAKTPEDLIITADKALYLAKADGRNRVKVYSKDIEKASSKL